MHSESAQVVFVQQTQCHHVDLRCSKLWSKLCHAEVGEERLYRGVPREMSVVLR